MPIKVLFLCCSLLLLAACAPAQPAAIQELDGGSVLPTVTPRIIFVTPTQDPTPFPTVTIASPQAPASATPRPTNTPDFSAAQAACDAMLTTLYTEASEACIGEPSGFFCNGGLPPRAEPEGIVSSQIGVQGSLVPLDVVESVQTPPLLSESSGGLMWLRVDDPFEMNALLIGDVQLRDVTPQDSSLSAWQSMAVITAHDRVDCATAPYSTFLVQGPWGRATRLVINGVSVELRGSIAVQTHNNQTFFIALEGESRLTIFGETRRLLAGQELVVDYADENFTRPAQIPGDAQLLEFDYIDRLPIALLDRPVLLPQPGYAFTDGRVNLRSEPTVSSNQLAELPDEQLVSLLAMNTERTWYHVQLPNGETGWVRADLLEGEIGEITLTYDVTPQPPGRYGDSGNLAQVIAPTGGNLREAPDVQFPVLNTLAEGTSVDVIARSPYSNWVKVDAGGQIGWMALVTLETTTVVQFLPVDYDVPLPPGPTATPFFAFGGGHAYPDPRGGQ